ncbi:unnamed protein product [Brassicogethes aeneus]|uniref:C2H2-type domain-containing protein n=1 Tax=Brassicogethes aeneus TaxID=1431903 RepID=A0A9P0AWP3_BRAAE|nr:unnamed protein product [Brassicogethes aeneus]
MCKFGTTEYQNYLSHIRTCKPAKKQLRNIKCPYCRLKLRRNLTLQSHVFCKHRERNAIEKKVEITCKIFTCDVCKFATVKPYTFNKHIQNCFDPNVKEIICPYCEIKFKSKYSLQGHVFTKHKEQNSLEKKIEITFKIYNCTNCEFTTMYLHIFRKHIISCLGTPVIVEGLKCSLCLYTTNIEQDFILHHKLHKDRKCPYCNIQLKTNLSLQGHVISQHKEQNDVEKKIPMNLKTHNCPNCSFVTMFKKVQERHLKSCSTIPKIIPDIKCLQCPFKTKIKQEYILHHKKHIDENLTCPYCELKTEKARELQQHVFSMHKQQNTVENKVEVAVTSLNCKKCSFNTFTMININGFSREYPIEPEKEVPQSKENEIQKIYQCKLCEFGTTDIQKYLSHTILSHGPRIQSSQAKEYPIEPEKEVPQSKENEIQKKYHCKLCEFGTTDIQKYLSHTILSHGPRIQSSEAKEYPIEPEKEVPQSKENKIQKKYHCKLCEFGTTDIQKYLSHTILSHGSRTQSTKSSYCCPYCSFSATMILSLEEHVLRKHRELNDIKKEVKFTHKIVTCNNCTFATVQPEAYTQHLKNCLGSNMTIQKCPYCNFFFKSTGLEIHVNRKHKEQNDADKKIAITKKYKDIKCLQCPFKTKYQQEYILHHKNHLDENLTCPYCVCFREYPIEPEKEVPQSKENEIQKIYQCKLCEFGTTDIQKYLSHTILSHGPRIQSSQAKEYPIEPEKEVSQSKENEIQKKYHCKLCEFGTTDVQKYLSHTILSHGPKTQSTKSSYCCPYCSFSATMILSLEEHVLRKHWELNDIKKEVKFTHKIETCNKCTFTTVQAEAYTQHLKNCLGSNMAFKKCPYCKFFFQSTGLQTHVNRKHKEQNDVDKKIAITYTKCPYCDKIVQQKTGLQRHVIYRHKKQNDVEKKIHINIKTHNCPNCSFVTASKILYEKHLKSHTQCPYCNIQVKTCLQSHVLSKHKKRNDVEKKIHIIIKTHNCPNCSFVTASKILYEMHLKSCSTPKVLDIQCLQCPFKTKNQQEYILHHKNHLDENLTCPYCCLKTTKPCELQQHVFCMHNQQNILEKKVEVAINFLKCKKCFFKTVRHDLYVTHVKFCE